MVRYFIWKIELISNTLWLTVAFSQGYCSLFYKHIHLLKLTFKFLISCDNLEIVMWLCSYILKNIPIIWDLVNVWDGFLRMNYYNIELNTETLSDEMELFQTRVSNWKPMSLVTMHYISISLYIYLSIYLYTYINVYIYSHQRANLKSKNDLQ